MCLSALSWLLSFFLISLRSKRSLSLLQIKLQFSTTVALLTGAVLVAFCASLVRSDEELRIMAVGDSITEGVLAKLRSVQRRRIVRVGLPSNFSRSSYQCYLQELLRVDAGYRTSVRFVGPFPGFCSPPNATGKVTSEPFPEEMSRIGHAGRHSAAVKDMLLPAVAFKSLIRPPRRQFQSGTLSSNARVSQWAWEYQPSAVLLLGGTNDVIQGFEPAVILENLAKVVHRILIGSLPTGPAKPDIKALLVGTLLPASADEARCILAEVPCPKRIVSLNRLIKKHFCRVVAGLLSHDVERLHPQLALGIAPMPFKDLDHSDKRQFVDGLHPSFEVEIQMAQRWYDALFGFGVVSQTSKRSVVEGKHYMRCDWRRESTLAKRTIHELIIDDQQQRGVPDSATSTAAASPNDLKVAPAVGHRSEKSSLSQETTAAVAVSFPADNSSLFPMSWLVLMCVAAGVFVVTRRWKTRRG